MKAPSGPTPLVSAAVALLALAGAASVCAQSKIIEATVHSPALEHNVLGDPADQKIAIYLPAEYDGSPKHRFATIYYLEGFAGGSPTAIAESLKTPLDELVASRAIEPMILVVPNGLNRYRGSFYTDSVVTGNWATYVVRDITDYVDTHYRTIRQSAARGIMGHSMGGYGALMLAFQYPEIFSSVYALSPVVTVLDGDLGPSNPAWYRAAKLKSVNEAAALADTDFMLAVVVALDAAFAPNLASRPLLGDPPFRVEQGQRTVDTDVLAKFQSKVVSSAIPALASRISRLTGIYIDYGLQDEFSHIPLGARAVSAQLSILGIPHTLEAYSGDHLSRIDDRIAERSLPWLSKQLRH